MLIQLPIGNGDEVDRQYSNQTGILVVDNCLMCVGSRPGVGPWCDLDCHNRGDRHFDRLANVNMHP